MNDDIKEIFRLAKEAGYPKDIHAFKKYITNDATARAEAFKFAEDRGRAQLSSYPEDEAAFSELMGIVPGKVNVQSAGATVDGNQAPQNEKAPGSYSSDGSIDPKQDREYASSAVHDGNFTEAQLSVMFGQSGTVPENMDRIPAISPQILASLEYGFGEESPYQAAKRATTAASKNNQGRDIDWTNTNVVKKASADAVDSYIKTDPTIARLTAKALQDNAALIENEMNRIAGGLTENSTEADIEAAEKEYNAFVSNIIMRDGTDVSNHIEWFHQNITTNFYDKHAEAVSDEDYYGNAWWSGILGASGKNMYGAVRGSATSIKAVGLADDRLENARKKLSSIEYQAEQQGWNESSYMRPRGVYETLASSSNYVSPGGELLSHNYGEAKKQLEAEIKLREDERSAMFSEIWEREELDKMFESTSFMDIASGGGNIAGFMSQILAPMALGAVTFGASFVAQAAGDTYLGLIRKKAKEVYDTEDPTLDQVKAILDSPYAAEAREIAANVGLASGLAEVGGLTSISKAAKLGMKEIGKSILRSESKVTVRNFIKTVGGHSKTGAINESFTEVLQTGISDIGMGEFSGVEAYVESAGAGALMGGFLPAAGMIVKQTNAEIKAGYNIVAGKLNKNSAEAFFNEKLRELEQAKAAGIIDEDGYEGKKSALLEVRNVNTKIPKSIVGKARDQAVDLLIEKQQLTESLEGIDKDMGLTERERLVAVTRELQALEMASKNNALAKRVAEDQLGITFYTENDELPGEVADRAATTEAKQEGQKGENLGFYDSDSGRIYVNTAAAAKMGNVHTGAHEVLHALLRRSLQTVDADGKSTGGKGVVAGLAKALLDELGKGSWNLKSSGHFEKVLNAYRDEPSATRAEEVLTVFSEEMNQGTITYDESFFVKIGDFIRRLLQNTGLKEIKFDSGLDVFNFLKDYNKAISKGKLEGSMLKLKDEGASVGGNIEQTTDKEEFSGVTFSKPVISEDIQAAWNKSGKDSGWEVSEMYRGMAIAKAAKYRNLPSYQTNQDILVDEILTGKRGVYDMVQTYDPSKNDSLSAYINSFLPRRVIEAANRVLGTEFTEDVTERKDIAAAPEAAQVETDAPKVASVIRRKIGLDEKQMNIVRRAAIRALATAPKIKAVVAGKPRAFNDHLVKTYTTLLFKMLKNHMGTGADYRMWVKQNFDVFNNNIGLSTLINGRMSLFYKPVLNEAGVQERMSITEANDAGIPLDKAGAGPAKWQRVSPTLDEFYDWAMGKGMAANTKPARKTTMARLLSREIGLDATMEVLNNVNQPDYTEQGIIDRDTTINMLERVGLANGDQMAETEVIASVAAAISRNRDLRFSKAVSRVVGKDFNNFPGLKIKSAALRKKIQAIVNWHERNNLTGLMTDRKLEGNAELSALYEDAIATAKRVRLKSIKAAMGTEFKNFIDQAVRDGLEYKTLYRVFGSEVAQTKAEYKAVIDELLPILVQKHGALDAVVFVIKFFQPSGAQRGAKSPWQRNKKFRDDVIDPMIKDLGLEEGIITLGDPKLRTKSGKLRKGLQTFMLNGEKITPSTSLEASQGIYKKILDGDASSTDIAKYDEQATGQQEMITKFATLLRESNLTPKAKATFVWGLGNMTRGAGRLAYRFGGFIEGSNLDPLNYTVEHNIPWAEMASKIALYIEGAIELNELEKEWEAAEIYLHPSVNAKKMNAAGLQSYDAYNRATTLVSGVKLPKRIAEFMGKGDKAQSSKDVGVVHSKGLNRKFNEILEDSANLPANKIISPTEAIKRGKKASRRLKNQGIMISSAEDFVGLMYKMLAKGKTGETQLEWLLDKLVIPYDVAVDNVSIARLLKSEQLRKISKSAKLKGMLKAEAFEGMTGEDAVRLYIWNLRGVAKGKFVKEAYVDMAVDYMSKNPELKAYADAVHAIAGAVAYAAPNARWAHGSIEMDLVGGINGELRALELEQSGWSLNVKEIFSEDNLNKLEALYGVNYVAALKNILQRMKSGRNRIDQETDKTSKKAQGWISNQVGAIMFLNMRSALLQGLSALNYINTTDHNPLQAIRRMLNVPQYVKDTKFLLDSAFMKDRRMGMRIDVNEEDVARASRGTGNVISRALKIALNKGFIPTRLMDTAAIVIGGAGFYRSRANTYVDGGMSIASAEALAFADFRKATINSQQSSDPRMVSQQQSSTMGRFVLQFGNTPGQYTRIQIKAVKDIINGRGDMKAHIGKILYYGMIQQALFTFAQQALWAAFLDDDDEWIASEEGRGLVDGMLSSTLRGLGLYGAIIDTAMRTAKVWEKESSKGYMGVNEKVVIEALGISPSVKSIARKTTNAMNINKYRGDEFGVDPYSLHSPEVEQAAWLLEGTVNIPSKRILDKMHHIESIMSGQNEAWQNVALFFGFHEWQVGAGEAGKKAKQRKLDKKGIVKPVEWQGKDVLDMNDAELNAWLKATAPTGKNSSNEGEKLSEVDSIMNLSEDEFNAWLDKTEK